jgi:hypothetical protein
MSYLARITECKHGRVERHPTPVVLKDRLGPGKDDVGYDWTNMCPGGTTTRIEPDYEAAARSLSSMFYPNEYSEGYALAAVTLAVDAALGGTE